MSSLKNKLSVKSFGLVYPFEYDFKCHYNTIAPGHLIKKAIFCYIYGINIKIHHFSTCKRIISTK